MQTFDNKKEKRLNMTKKMILVFLIIIIFFSGCACYLNNVYDIESRYELRYNYYENVWEYQKPSAVLRYNYYEQRWQFVDDKD